MKKILTILLVAALVAAFLVPSVFATEAPQLVVESKSAVGGEEIVLNVSIVNNPGISNGKLDIVFDDAALELVEIDVYSGLLMRAMCMTNGKAMNFVAVSDIKGDGVLFSIKLKVKDDAVGEIKVDVAVDYIDSDTQSGIEFEVLAGTVSVAHECAPVDVAEVPATCLNDGVKAHQKCACGKLFVDGVEVTAEDLVIAAGEHNLVHVEAVEAGCHMNGNIEHWYCTGCETVWADEALTQVTNHMNVILPATGGDVVHMEAVEPGCHFIGHIEHWYCNECEQVWQDEALTQLTNHMNVIVPAVGGEVVHVEAKEANCYENGNIEHWYCETCEQVWQDEALTQLTNHMNVIIGALNHQNLVHIESVEPGCHFEGVMEHWYCNDCETVWADEALTQITNHMNVIVGATGHTYVDGVCQNCGEVDKDVPPTGDMTAIVFALVAVSGMGLVALTKKKED